MSPADRGSAPDAATAPLLIRFGRIGDMVLQLPLLHLLRRRYGQPCRLLTSGGWSASLFASCDVAGRTSNPYDPKAENTLNGIAYDEATDRIFVTGKNWKKLYEIKLRSKQ